MSLLPELKLTAKSVWRTLLQPMATSAGTIFNIVYKDLGLVKNSYRMGAQAALTGNDGDECVYEESCGFP